MGPYAILVGLYSFFRPGRAIAYGPHTGILQVVLPLKVCRGPYESYDKLYLFYSIVLFQICQKQRMVIISIWIKEYKKTPATYIFHAVFAEVPSNFLARHVLNNFFLLENKVAESVGS